MMMGMFSRKKASKHVEFDLEVDTGTASGQAKMIGLFSYALGTAQILRPGSVNRLMGVPDHNPNHAMTRVIGIREIVTGTGVLFGKNTSGWMWGRVAGDIMDISNVAGQLAGRLGTREKLIPTLLVLSAIAVLDAKIALDTREA
jgi:hypothetical protein